MRLLALLAVLQISAAPRTAGKSHGVVHDLILEGVNFQEYAPGSSEGLPAPPGVIVLEPATLEFGVRQLGEAHAERVLLFNRSNSTLRLASISGSTHNFHASFFDSKVIPPHGNTSFSVVFLGRREGPVDSHLYLHTSLGSHKYAVSGVSVMSEYRLGPLLGVRLPRNVSFSPTIFMHNPHPDALQVLEVYSSGGGVTLELPDGGTEGPQSLWLLPPHTTRPLVRLHYTPPPHPHPPHTAYIRIKLNKTSTLLVVPVEVGVERDAGPYVRPHAVDAGFGGTGDPPAQVPLAVGNSGERWVRLTRAGFYRPGDGDSDPYEDEAAWEDHEPSWGASPVDVELVRHSLPPRAQAEHVATLTVHWDRVYETGATHGEVRLLTADRCLSVPYRATALPGALVFNASSLTFVTSSPDVMAARQFSVRNDFAAPVFVTDVEMTDTLHKHFILSGFTPRAVPAATTAELFSLRLLEYNASQALTSHVTLLTNVTSYRVHVHVYAGTLDLEWEWPTWTAEALSLGVVGVSSTTRVTGALRNDNPAAVRLRSCGVAMEGGAAQLLGCVGRDGNVTGCVSVEAGQRALVRLSAVAPVREGTVSGLFWCDTEHGRLQRAVSLRAARGRLQARPLALDNCFPGTTCSDSLHLESSLSFPLRLLNVSADPPDPRIKHKMEADDGWEIEANSAGGHGRVHFSPGVACRPHCYTGVRFNTTAHMETWLDRITTEEDWLATDVDSLSYHRQMYSELAASELTLRLRTSEVFNQLVTGSIHYTWPRLAFGSHSAGLIGVGGTGTFNVTIDNPSNEESLYVHAVVATSALHRIPSSLRVDCPRGLCAWSPRAFRITSIHKQNCTVVRDGASPVLHIPPSGVAKLEVQFTPHSPAQHTALLLLRNNLTILEAVHLTGQGAFPSFKFGNRKPGSGTPLLFELTDKHLKDCDRDRARLAASPNLTVKRSFTARNTGDIPISVSTFYINGFECEGYGFKVLNCAGFELSPNGTYKVDIAFTPDFTLSKIKRTLIVMTSLSMPVNYTLVTTVPAHLLGPCGAVLSRPPWETYVRNVVVSLMICIGLCVLAVGFMESDRILKMATAAMSRTQPVQPPLDLRTIGQCKPWEWSDPPDKQKHKNLSWNDDRRLSEEAKMKYEEPQKSKKKVVKKYSNEPNLGLPSEKNSNEPNLPSEKEVEDKKGDETFEAAENTSKSDDGENSTPPSEFRDTTPPVQTEKETDRKIFDLPEKVLASLSEPKKRTKAERRQRCEDDASSTATESSNNDEPERDQEQRSSVERNKQKSSPTNAKKMCVTQYKDSYEGDGEDEEYDRPIKLVPQTLSQKLQRNKENSTPTPTKQTKETHIEPEKPKETKEPQQLEAVHHSKQKNSKPTNKKDKQVKKKNEKLPFAIRNDTVNTSRSSPPVVNTPSSRWGENRATFSDVVSRSDTNTFSTILAPKKIDKPKEPVLNKKEKPLGPIGSNFAQKRSPGHSETDSLYSNPIRQEVKFEDLVHTDNNNSLFYFGSDNARTDIMQPMQPREIGVIGKPNYQTPIGGQFGQVRYSPSMECRMEYEGWEQRTGSPGLASSATTQPNIYNRSVYSDETAPAYNNLWDMPATSIGGVTQTNEMPSSSPWLWGYNNPVRPPPGFPAHQQPISRQFDPFQSKVDWIWSPASSQSDAWRDKHSDDAQQQ